MKQSYWNNIAQNYNTQIHDSIHTDKNNLIRRTIKKYANPSHHALDLGCGPGKYLPYLAAAFKFVTAIDHSQKLLNLAKSHAASHNNIQYIRANLANPKVEEKKGPKARSKSIRKANFATLTNVLISHHQSTRTRILQTAITHLKPKAHLLILVPSVESTLYTNHILLKWNHAAGLRGKSARAETLNLSPNASTDLLKGIIPIDSIPTKHYLAEELHHLATDHSLNPIDIKKVQYPWTSEFTEPPPWLNEPYPWDWLLLAQKA